MNSPSRVPLSSSCSQPPPEVGSALVSLRLPGERGQLALANEQSFLNFVKLCFAQKRKTMVNNLRGLVEPPHLKELLKTRSFRRDARAEQLSVGDLADLYTALSEPPLPGSR